MRLTRVLWFVAIGLLAAGSARADYYDSFSDGWWERDPNDPAYDANDPYWTDPNNAVTFDVDNPDWTIYDSLPGSLKAANIGSDSVADHGLRLAASGVDIFGFVVGILSAGVMTYAMDPNIDAGYFMDDTDHYILSWVYYPSYYDPNHNNGYNDPNYDPNLDDPNDDRSTVTVMMHADDLVWTSLSCDYNFSNLTSSGWGTYRHYQHQLNIQSIYFDRQFLAPWNKAAWLFRRIWIDPNGLDGDPNDCTFVEPPEGGAGIPRARDPNYDDPSWYQVSIDQWERQGFWILFQFQRDPNYASGDPNGKFLHMAIWSGDKYAWEGAWLIGGELSTRWWHHASGHDSGEEWYWPEGFMAISSQSDPCYANGFPATAVFDDIEVRTGVFDPDAKLVDLQIKNSKYGQVAIDPELVDPNDTHDPNLIDPNDGTTFPSERLLRYTTGTEVMLVAQPLPDRSFKNWTVYDPNYPGDGNYATLDTNAVLYLTMDADYQVEALFNCGSGVPPFVAMTLLALGLGVVIRRMV